MGRELPIAAAVAPSAWQMYRSMVGVGIVCGLFIVTVFQLTRPVIERKRAAALQAAIFQVLPAARSSETFRLTDDEQFERADASAPRQKRVFAGYDENRRLIGLAVEAEGIGYQDVIRLLYGYSFDDEAIVGIRILESKETPGLGDKIEKDPEFLKNFVQLDASLAAGSKKLTHSIVAVKNGKKTEPWQVDGITGATISSAAIAAILDRSASYWVPRIRGNVADFTEGS